MRVGGSNINQRKGDDADSKVVFALLDFKIDEDAEEEEEGKEGKEEEEEVTEEEKEVEEEEEEEEVKNGEGR